MSAIKNGLRLTALIGALFILSGCEHPPVKPTEDSKRLHQIDAFVENLRVTYEGRNYQAFSSLYPGDRPEDLRTIAAFMDSATSPRLDFLIDRIVLQEDTVRVALHWEFRWSSDAAGAVKQRGNALFRLAGKSDLRLETIEGDNPFTASASDRISRP
ncbi:MAG: hypothetical protein HY349_00025 [Nitrospirae bacterium]|nr:hypothetical protein [Nitrospirota bacterium]